MKNLWKILLVTIFFSLIIADQGKAQNAGTKLDAFDEIRVTGNIEVVLEQGAEESATIQATNIPEDEVSVEVERGTLKLRLLNSIFYKDDHVRVFVSYKQLRYIRASAGAKISSKDVLQSDKLEFKAGSGADISMEVACNAIEASITEGGALSLSGQSRKQDITVGTGGFYDGLAVKCETTYVKANTGGNAKVYASKFLEVSANTGGSVDYRGDPQETSFKEFMSGGIHKI